MTSGWHRRLGDRIIRRPRLRDLLPIRLKPEHRRRRTVPTAATAVTLPAMGFAGLILLGTLFLSLPVAHVGDGITPFRIALFTATSAVCVTGLVIVNTTTYWTFFGQAVIAALMYLGGLGIITAGTLLFMAIGRRITLPDRLVLRESLGGGTLGGGTLGSVTRLVRLIVVVATLIQVVGAVVLFARFQALFPLGRAAWLALFHSISGFNNAGFAILRDSASLSAFRDDYLVLLTIALLIVLGGISFAVIGDIVRRRRFSRWSLDTRLVVLGSVALWLLGAAGILAIERTNASTLGALPADTQVLNALFHSVSGRTAGFSTIDFGAIQPATTLLFAVLMFIGGASASTAGGIKVNTVMLLVVAALASVLGRARVEVFRREVPYPQVIRAIALVMLAVSTIVAIFIALMATEAASLDIRAFSFADLVFELVSAFGTVGLSTGITASLTDTSQYLLVGAMYLGRLGPLTIALGLALRERRALYRYAQEHVRIG